MLHVNEKIVSYENNFWQKKKKIEEFDITSIILEKTLEYLNIHESLWSENLRKYYLRKGIFLYVFHYPERYYTSTT